MLHIHSLEEEILILGKSENGEGTLLISAAATPEDNGDGVQGTSQQRLCTKRTHAHNPTNTEHRGPIRAVTHKRVDTHTTDNRGHNVTVTAAVATAARVRAFFSITEPDDVMISPQSFSTCTSTNRLFGGCKSWGPHRHYQTAVKQCQWVGVESIVDLLSPSHLYPHLSTSLKHDRRGGGVMCRHDSPLCDNATTR